MRRGLAVLSIMLLFSGCSVLTSVTQPRSSSSPYDTWSGLKVLLRDDCPLTPVDSPDKEGLPLILIPVIAAVAKPVVEKSLDALAEYLRNLKESYTATSEAKGAGDFYTPKDAKTVNPTFGCVIVVRGTFGDSVVREETHVDKAIRWTGANLAKVRLVEPPALYLELRLAYLGGDPVTHLTVRPVFLDYLQTSAERTSSENKKDLLLVLALKTLEQRGTEQKEATFATFTLSLKDTPSLRIRRLADTAVTPSDRSIENATVSQYRRIGTKERDVGSVQRCDDLRDARPADGRRRQDLLGEIGGCRVRDGVVRVDDVERELARQLHNLVRQRQEVCGSRNTGYVGVCTR